MDKRARPVIVATTLLHTTGIKYTTNTKVKKVKSKRDLNDGVPHDQPQPRTSSASSTPSLHSKQLPPIHHASISTASATPTSPARESRTVSFVGHQPPGIHRGSIVPLEATPAIQSTDLLMADGVREQTKRRSLKRTNSERKAAKKARGKGGKEEKETEWVYEEKELKIAICCVIA